MTIRSTIKEAKGKSLYEKCKQIENYEKKHNYFSMYKKISSHISTQIFAAPAGKHKRTNIDERKIN